MAEAYQFELVSPERLLLSEQVEDVVIPGTDGEMTVMALHAPAMTTIRPGVVTVIQERGAEKFVVFGGFADIMPQAARCWPNLPFVFPSSIAANSSAICSLPARMCATPRTMLSRAKAQEYLDNLTTMQAAL